jgi:hypothetical protein
MSSRTRRSRAAARKRGSLRTVCRQKLKPPTPTSWAHAAPIVRASLERRVPKGKAFGDFAFVVRSSKLVRRRIACPFRFWAASAGQPPPEVFR